MTPLINILFHENLNETIHHHSKQEAQQGLSPIRGKAQKHQFTNNKNSSGSEVEAGDSQSPWSTTPIAKE